MQFVTLPEPHVGCRNVLAHAPLLYRLDARSPTSSIVVTEYGGGKRLPSIETSGTTSENRRLFDSVLAVLHTLSKQTNLMFPVHHFEQTPMFILDLRPSPRQHALLIGGIDGRARVVSAGHEYWTTEMVADMSSVNARLRELSHLYYGV